jgi:hypothetical protein
MVNAAEWKCHENDFELSMLLPRATLMPEAVVVQALILDTGYDQGSTAMANPGLSVRKNQFNHEESK